MAQERNDRLKHIEERLRAEQERRNQANLEVQETRKSIIADKIRAAFGDDRFAVLQEAIGRAPGTKHFI